MSLTRSKNTGGVQSIERSCRILDLLSKNKQSYSIHDLAQTLRLPKPTVHRILSTFRRLGYVTQDDTSKEYRLGFRLVELGQVVLNRIDLRKEAEPFLNQLAGRVQETVHLVLLDEGEIVYLDKVEKVHDQRSLRMASRIGMRNYAHSCAVGKVLLAFLPHGERDKIFAEKGLPKLTNKTIVDVDKLKEHLAEVRVHGYAVDDEENEEGIRCVAAPIRNDVGEVTAAISISGPSVRMTKEIIDRELVKQVVKTAAEISKKLGFRTEAPRERR